MKRMNLFLAFTFLILLMTACSSSDSEQLKEIDGPAAEEAALFVESYKKQMVEAVNTGDFNDLESYLITNNSFYHSLRRYVSDLHSDHIAKELVSFDVVTVLVDEIDGIYVDANEKVKLIETNGEQEIERNVQFELIRGGDGSLRIVTIKERK